MLKVSEFDRKLQSDILDIKSNVQENRNTITETFQQLDNNFNSNLDEIKDTINTTSSSTNTRLNVLIDDSKKSNFNPIYLLPLFFLVGQ